jgi:flagellar motor switch protein FliN/FliY
MEKSPDAKNTDDTLTNENTSPGDSSQSEDSAMSEAAQSDASSTIAASDGMAPPQDAKEAQQDVSEENHRNTEKKSGASLKADGMNLDMILDIPLEITVELGRTQMPINELLQLGPGSAVALSKLEGEPVDILANDRLIAKGIVLVKDEKYGIQITEITGRLERLRGLR